MKLKRLYTRVFALLLAVISFGAIQAQTVTGTVTDKSGAPVSGASVVVKNSTTGTSTDNNGKFTIKAAADAVLIITSVGLGAEEVNVGGKTDVSITLQPATSNDLNEVVVVGYGTARKRDLTGSVGSVKAKDFVQGAIASPDQLIQGKVAGVQIVTNNGSPGAAATIRIRGNNSIRSGSQPLFVLDGVALDGRSGRPGFNASGLGNSPSTNPLNFINPEDIATIDVLKDASAAAIYGSRAANGVILISTKKGIAGRTSVDFSATAGISSLARRIEVMDGDQYRAVLKKYSITKGDYGGNIDALDEILRTAVAQNYSVSMAGGSETARFRLALGAFNQQGIVEKSELKKYTASLTSNFKFLESKKLGLDVNLFTTQLKQDDVPITNDAGAQGSLIINALQWNPTLSLRNANGTIRTYATDANLDKATINPLTLSQAYNDISDVNKIFVIASPYYTFNSNWEYRANISYNSESGKRRAWVSRLLNIPNIEGQGYANISDATLETFLFNQTVTFRKEIANNLSLNALVGYEFQDFKYRAASTLYRGFGLDNFDYSSIIGSAAQANQSERNSSIDPKSQLQSFFGRANFNYNDRYLFTATVRADGSTKFGENNRYGVFPSFAAAWNIDKEAFMTSSQSFSALKLRLGYGTTGNQEIPSGAAQERYQLTTGGGARLVNAANPDLKWESSTTLNVGLDFGIMKNRLTGSVDYFRRNTNDLLFNFEVIQPAPPGSRIWQNLDGEIVNSGVELFVSYLAIKNKNVTLDVSANATFLSNEFKDYVGPQILTGAVSGQGVSGASVQQMRVGLPLNAFYTRRFTGLDRTGNNTFANSEALEYVGNPNPKALLGVSTDLTVKKVNFRTSWNGAFGHDIYNNTLNSVVNISNLNGQKNVSPVLIGDIQESLTNPASPSSRYLESGSYVRLTSAILSYQLGKIGKVFRNASVSLTGQNLFVITKFSGFDPEVNTDKQIDGVSSFGIEYAPFPNPRTFLLGFRVSL